GLRADGESTVRGSITGNHPSVTWDFDGPDLGCGLSYDSSGVTIRAGTNTGTVYVRATAGGSGCYELPLDLVDCDSCNSGDCQGAGAFSAKNASVNVRVGLGWALAGNTAGYLEIKES